MKYIKCLLGFHDWLLSNALIRLGTVRQCRRCLRMESASYDMADGGTIWEEVAQ